MRFPFFAAKNASAFCLFEMPDMPREQLPEDGERLACVIKIA